MSLIAWLCLHGMAFFFFAKELEVCGFLDAWVYHAPITGPKPTAHYSRANTTVSIPGAPHVNLLAVVPVAQQQLRGPVPEGHDPVGQTPGHVLGQAGPRQTKVGNLEDALVVNQDVGAF
jgi:hypothetical protein